MQTGNQKLNTFADVWMNGLGIYNLSRSTSVSVCFLVFFFFFSVDAMFIIIAHKN